MEAYKVYVKANEQGYITAVNSSAFVDGEEWTKIDEGYGDRFHHAQANYFHLPIITDDGCFRYKLADGLPALCTEEEIEAQRIAVEETPTAEERIAELEAALDLLLSGVTE